MKDPFSCLCCAADVVVQKAAAFKKYADKKFMAY
jgi:hypothetical protein